jgi:hypothetical protein
MPRRAARGAVPGQGGGSNCLLCWPPARRRAVTDISITPSLKGRGHLARSTRCPLPSAHRKGKPFDFSRQVIMHTRRTSRFGRPQTASSLRAWMRWPIAPTDEFVGVWIPELSCSPGWPRSLSKTTKIRGAATASAVIILLGVSRGRGIRMARHLRGLTDRCKNPPLTLPNFPMTPIIRPTRYMYMHHKRIGRIGPILTIYSDYPTDML